MSRHLSNKAWLRVNHTYVGFSHVYSFCNKSSELEKENAVVHTLPSRAVFLMYAFSGAYQAQYPSLAWVETRKGRYIQWLSTCPTLSRQSRRKQGNTNYEKESRLPCPSLLYCFKRSRSLSLSFSISLSLSHSLIQVTSRHSLQSWSFQMYIYISMYIYTENLVRHIV